MFTRLMEHLRTETGRERESKFWYIVLGLPALFPLICLIPDIITANSSDLDSGIADVTGTGAELCLFITLLITPLVIITGKRWFLPLRKWYGIMTAIIAITDGVIASITTVEFGTAPLGRLTDHVFLLMGFLMVLLLTVVLATSNNASMRIFGRYWPKIQKITYIIWGLLGIHLAFLFNLGPYSGGMITHQRFYQYAACSIALLIYRLPVMRKAAVKMRKLGFNWAIYIAAIPWVALFVVPLSFIINEEVFKGVATFASHSINN